MDDPTSPPLPLFIAGSGERRYLRVGMVRLLSSLLVALALFASPLMMANGAGMAMSHASTETSSALSWHCTEDEAPSDAHHAPKKMSCATGCAAFLSDERFEGDAASVALAVLVVPQARSLTGIHPEGETPPPRITPES